MQTLHQVVAKMARTSGQNKVILSLDNQGGSHRTSRLSDVFTEEQINALESNCLICERRNLPEAINTPAKLQEYLADNEISLVTFDWIEIITDGTKVESTVFDTYVL